MTMSRVKRTSQSSDQIVPHVFVRCGIKLFKTQCDNWSKQVRSTCANRNRTVVFQGVVVERHQPIVQPFFLFFVDWLSDKLLQQLFPDSVAIGGLE